MGQGNRSWSYFYALKAVTILKSWRGFLPDAFQGLKYGYERDILRDLPEHFRQEAQKGEHVRFTYGNFPRLVHDKKDWCDGPNGNIKAQRSL